MKRTIHWRFVIPLLVLAVLLYFLAVGLTGDPRVVPSPLIGKPAPEFQLTRLDQAQAVVRKQDLRGQVWLLNVWASWCTACKEEHPVLLEYARTRLPQWGVKLYGLDYKDERMAGLRWLQVAGNPYQYSLWDGDGRLGIDFGVYGVPETFLIDAEGVVRYKHIGPLTPAVLEREIEPLIRRLHGTSNPS